jgi:hypothetical protein
MAAFMVGLAISELDPTFSPPDSWPNDCAASRAMGHVSQIRPMAVWEDLAWNWRCCGDGVLILPSF